MSAQKEADVIVIGSGQAGVPLATRLAAAGKNVVLVERGHLGGTCVNVGCTPTKTLVASARAAHVARTSARLGVQTGEVKVDFAAVMSRKDAIVKRWRDGVEHHVDGAKENLETIIGHARFVDERVIEVNGKRHTAKQIVINVGARPAVPAVKGLPGVPYLTSSSLLELKELPKHLVILGAGYIACEMGQMFRRFGSEVTLVAPSARLLPREDEAVSEAMMAVFRAEGISLELTRKVAEIKRTEEGVELDIEGQSTAIHGTHLLVATGRVPNTGDLGCDDGKISVDGSAHIVVDESYETSTKGVFAVGDCIAGPQFTHVAWDDHRVLFETLMGRRARAHTDRLVPYTIFTDPQVAGVGLSERSAREEGRDIEVATMPFGNIARAIETDETAGVVKVILDRKTEQILGAFVVGVDAGELIHIFSVLMQAKGSARAIVDGEFVHPTFAEGMQSAVMKLGRYALS